jgi:hypothetical protein
MESPQTYRQEEKCADTHVIVMILLLLRKRVIVFGHGGEVRRQTYEFVKKFMDDEAACRMPDC